MELVSPISIRASRHDTTRLDNDIPPRTCWRRR